MTAPKSVLLDNDFLDDSEIQLTLEKFGEVAAGRYARLITAMNKKSGRMAKESVFVLGRALGTPKDVWVEFCDYCVTIGLLKQNETEFFIPRLERDARNLREKQKKWRDSKKNPRGIQRESGTPSKEEEGEEEQEKELEDLKKNGAHPPQPVDPPENADLELWALTPDAFTPPDDPICQGDTRFLGAGRRPLKKYPDIWLTQHELYNVFKTYIDAGVPKNKLSKGFHNVQSKLLTYNAEKRRVQSVSAFCWLTGFVLTDVLKEIKASTDLQRSQKYLEAAQT